MLGVRDVLRWNRPVFALLLAGVVALLAFSGCGDDENAPLNPGGGANSTTFSGMFTSGMRSGTLRVTIGTTALAPRLSSSLSTSVNFSTTGTAQIDGVSYNLTGNYDSDADSFGLSGGGFAFSGTFQPSGHGRPTLRGIWSGPGGPDDHGEFICYLGSFTSVTAYCGVYHSNVSPPDSGRFSFSVVDTFLTGFAHAAGGTGGVYFEGTASNGSPRTINIAYTAPGYYILSAPGTISANGDVSGTYTFTDIAGNGLANDAGTYAGALCP